MAKKAALPLLAMLGLLILSYEMDVAKVALKAFRASTFNFSTIWIDFLIELVFAGVVIFLAWFILIKHEKDALAGWGFVVTGLLAFFLSTPFSIYLHSLFNVGIPPYKIRDFPFFLKNYYFFLRNFYFFLSSFTFFGFLTKASAITTMLGAAHLLRKPR
jgi:hypothetical protein